MLILGWNTLRVKLGIDVMPSLKSKAQHGHGLMKQALEGGGARGGVSSWNVDMTVKDTQATGNVCLLLEPRDELDELVEDVAARSPVILLEVGDAMITRREVLVTMVDCSQG